MASGDCLEQPDKKQPASCDGQAPHAQTPHAQAPHVQAPHVQREGTPCTGSSTIPSRFFAQLKTFELLSITYNSCC